MSNVTLRLLNGLKEDMWVDTVAIDSGVRPPYLREDLIRHEMVVSDRKSDIKVPKGEEKCSFC